MNAGVVRGFVSAVGGNFALETRNVQLLGCYWGIYRFGKTLRAALPDIGSYIKSNVRRDL